MTAVMRRWRGLSKLSSRRRALWMATFADMMSLLLCFFVLILSFAEMNVPKYKQISGSTERLWYSAYRARGGAAQGTELDRKAFTPSVAQPTPVETIRQQTTDETQPDLEKKLETKTEDYPTPEERPNLSKCSRRKSPRARLRCALRTKNWSSR